MLTNDIHRSRCPQAAGRQDSREQLIGAALQEWHASSRDPAHSILIDVQEGYLNPCIGQGNSQRKAHMPAATNYAHSRFHLEESFPQICSWHPKRSFLTIGWRCQPTMRVLVK
jgi:hypothetical protein